MRSCHSTAQALQGLPPSRGAEADRPCTPGRLLFLSSSFTVLWPQCSLCFPQACCIESPPGLLHLFPFWEDSERFVFFFSFKFWLYVTSSISVFRPPYSDLGFSPALYLWFSACYIFLHSTYSHRLIYILWCFSIFSTGFFSLLFTLWLCLTLSRHLTNICPN